MKYLTFSATLFLVHVLLPTIQCSIKQSNENLVEQTCQKTPFYDTCVSSLKSDPRSGSADVPGLALIMVDVISSNTNQLLTRINELIRDNPDPEIKNQLNDCADKYSVGILQADIPMATEALKKGNYKFAEQGTDDAANEANFCEDGFKGKSPLTDQNRILHEVSAVAASIVRTLL